MEDRGVTSSSGMDKETQEPSAIGRELKVSSS